MLAAVICDQYFIDSYISKAIDEILWLEWKLYFERRNIQNDVEES